MAVYCKFNGLRGCGLPIKIQDNNIYCGDEIDREKQYCRNCKRRLNEK